jgi:hypothetical protein
MSTIRRTIDDLPRAQAAAARPPSKNMLVLQPVVDAWWDAHTDDYEKAISELPFSASMASQRCDRSLFYTLTGAAESDPPTVADVWRMDLGSMVHTTLQSQLAALGQQGWRREIIVDLRNIGIQGSAHADLAQFLCIHCDAPIHMEDVSAVPPNEPIAIAAQCGDECSASVAFWIYRNHKGDHTWDPQHERADVTCEFKTIAGYAFKLSTTSFKGPPEGAKYAHVLQGGMCAEAMGCNKLVVAYLSMELVSPEMAKTYCDSEIGRFAAEWHFTVEELRPILDAEYARINRVSTLASADLRPAREIHDPEIPAGATMVDPLRSAWQLRTIDGKVADTGKMWNGNYCNYCRFQQLCNSDGPDAHTVDADI